MNRANDNIMTLTDQGKEIIKNLESLQNPVRAVAIIGFASLAQKLNSSFFQISFRVALAILRFRLLKMISMKDPCYFFSTIYRTEILVLKFNIKDNLSFSG